MQVRHYNILRLRGILLFTPHSRCSQRETCLRIRRGLFGGGPRHKIIVLGLKQKHKLTEGCCQTNEHEHRYLVDGNFYEITKDRHSVRAASRLSLKVLRFVSDLWELNRLWNEAWIETNFCRLCMRLNRSIALSLCRKGKCEFSTMLFAHRLITCFSGQPSSNP